MRAWYKDTKLKAANGDPESIKALEKKRLQGKAWMAQKRAELNRRAELGDEEAINLIAKTKDKKNTAERNKRRGNPDKHRADVKAWQHANRSRVTQKVNDWRKANPDAWKAIASARLAKIRGGDGNFGAQFVKQLMLSQRSKCIYCSQSLKSGYHLDHILPLSKGGDNNKRNVQLLCAKCNLRKHAKHPIDFAQENGMLL